MDLTARTKTPFSETTHAGRYRGTTRPAKKEKITPWNRVAATETDAPYSEGFLDTDSYEI
jgi:hypothetical protein